MNLATRRLCSKVVPRVPRRLLNAETTMRTAWRFEMWKSLPDSGRRFGRALAYADEYSKYAIFPSHAEF